MTTKADWFQMPTEKLNAEMREIVDALWFQILGNQASPEPTRKAVRALNAAATAFTDTLYQSDG